jgi:hypothetical protein
MKRLHRNRATSTVLVVNPGFDHHLWRRPLLLFLALLALLATSMILPGVSQARHNTGIFLDSTPSTPDAIHVSVQCAFFELKDNLFPVWASSAHFLSPGTSRMLIGKRPQAGYRLLLPIPTFR